MESGGVNAVGTRMGVPDTAEMPMTAKKLYEQGVEDAFQNVEPEEFAAEEVRTVCARPTNWQRVIHGDSFAYRLEVGLALVMKGHMKRAKKFCECGRGDMVCALADSFRIHPLRCGHRLCPRCARWRGGKYVKRVLDALRGRVCGYLVHMVFTQEVLPNERLEDTIARLHGKWKNFKGRARSGYRGGLRVLHVKRSWRKGGWHAHYHFVVEVPDLAVTISMAAKWEDMVREESDEASSTFIRVLADKGHVVSGRDDGDPLLWAEADNEVTRCLQYCMRDVCEGPDASIVETGDALIIDELLGALESRRQHELLGAWRHGSEDVEEEAEREVKLDEEKKKSAAEEAGILVGTVDQVRKDPRWWGRFSTWLLESCGANDTDYARRARRFAGLPCRLVDE